MPPPMIATVFFGLTGNLRSALCCFVPISAMRAAGAFRN
jgi:hypothetical protein